MSQFVDDTVQQVNALLGFRRIEQARDLTTAALLTEPESSVMWATLATIEYKREDFKAAIAACLRALEIEPTQRNALFILVPCYEATGRRKLARETADTLLSLNPEWVPALLQRAYIYAQWTGKVMPTDASKVIVMTCLDRAVELSPEEAIVLSDAARLYLSVHEFATARALMDHALELAPTEERIILASRSFTGEEGAVERELAVLESNPLSVMARSSFEWRLWSRVNTAASSPLWTAGLVIIVFHLFYDSGSAARVVAVLCAVLATLTLVAVAWKTRRIIPRDILRMTIEQNKLVAPSLIVSAVSSVVILVTTIVLALAPVTRSDDFFRDAISILSVVLLVQSLAATAVTMTIAHVDIQSMRFADTPAGRNALKRQGRSTSGGVLGIFGAIILVFVAIITNSYNSIYAATAIAVLCLAWTFTEFSANAYRRSQAYPTLWLAIVLFVIATAGFLLAGFLTVLQVSGIGPV